MNTITTSATDLKNNVSEILNSVYFNNVIAIVERHGKPIAHIVPVTKHENKKIAVLLSETFGSVPDFPDVTVNRKFRKRNINI